MSVLLVLDLGTSYFKGSLFDADLNLTALRRLPTPIRSTKDGRCEISPDRFRETIIRLVADLASEAPDRMRAVSHLSFATQTNSFVLLDADDRPTTPLVLWPDCRARGTAIPSMARTSEFRERTGVAAFDHSFMAAKLRWFQSHEPSIVAASSRLCLLSDYLTLWLTGCHATEAGVAGLTGLMDIHTLTWYEDVCEAFAISPSWLPEIVRAGADLGFLLPDRAESLGLSPSCRFVVGCLDQYAGAIGVGNVTAGAVSETTGTVLAAVRLSDRTHTNLAPGVFQGPGFEPGLYCQMIFGTCSANVLEAYRSSLGHSRSFTELDREAARVPPGAGGLRLPRDQTPESLARFFVDGTSSHGRGAVVRAILEGVANALKEQVDQLCGAKRPAGIACAGGAARSDLWLRIKADALRMSMTAFECPEPTSLGVALLVAHALTKRDLSSLAGECVRLRTIVEPTLGGFSPDSTHSR